MAFDPSISDFKQILKEELAARCRQNPRYSLRAFARDLELSPSRLSEILSGKQGLSRAAAERVATALGYSATERERFCDLIEAQHARSRKDREEAKVRLKKHDVPSPEYQLQLEAFKAIADWYHFAILELLNLDGVKHEPRWIARRLCITEFEVQLALDRLQRLGLIARKSGRIKLTHDTGYVHGDVPSDSVNTFLTQIQQKAIDALRFQPIAKRESRARIVAVDTSKVAEAKKALREFENKFCKRLSESDVKDGLYCLAIQFFELGEGNLDNE